MYIHVLHGYTCTCRYSCINLSIYCHITRHIYIFAHVYAYIDVCVLFAQHTMVKLIQSAFLHVALVPLSILILTLTHSHGYPFSLFSSFPLIFFSLSSQLVSLLFLVFRSFRFSVFPFLWIRLSHFPSFWFFHSLSHIHTFWLLPFIIWSISNFHANSFRTIPIFHPFSLNPDNFSRHFFQSL